MKIFDRLWVRFLLSSVAVLAVAMGTVSIYTHNQANKRFSVFLSEQQAYMVRGLVTDLGGYYRRQGGWSGVPFFLERLGGLTGLEAVLVDKEGKVVGNSLGLNLGNWRPPAGLPVIPIKVGHQVVGRLYLAPPPRPPAGVPVTIINLRDGNVARLYLPLKPNQSPNDALGPARQRFLSGLGRSLTVATLAGGLAAFILSLLLARLIARPLGIVAGAARKLAEGDFNQQVPERWGGEVGELARAFNFMVRRIEAADRLRRGMVADVAHDLRSPVGNLTGYLEALREGVLSPDAEVLGILSSEARDLHRLIEDLHELAMADDRGLTLRREMVDLAGLLRGVSEVFRLSAAEKGVELKAELAELPPLLADPQRLAQVLRNLMENALAASPAGSVISLCLRAGDAGEAVLEVADQGPGIDPIDLPHIFERFYRADRSRTPGTGHHGLGLAIAREWVLAHGGGITVDSEVGRGTTFRLTFPRAGPDIGAVLR